MATKVTTGEGGDEEWLRPRVLRHLTHPRACETADAWRAVLPANAAVTLGARKDALIAIVTELVPQLAEYKLMAGNLLGLLAYCQQEYAVATSEMIVTWLTRVASYSLVFREWLYAWLPLEMEWMVGVVSRDGHGCKAMTRWKQALLLAAMDERDDVLHERLLRYIDGHVGTLCGTLSSDTAAPVIAGDDVERLLVFYWQNALVLAPSALLCAVKLTVVLRTAGAGALQSDTVLVLLRWGRVLYPLLFENLLEYMEGMQVLVRAEPQRLRISPVLECVITDLTSTEREEATAALMARRDQLYGAYQRDVKHLYLEHCSAGCARPIKAEPSPVVDVDDSRVRAELVRDLAVLPSAAFAPVFAVYYKQVLQQRCLQPSTDSSQDCRVIHASAVEDTFELLEARSDPSSCLVVLGVIVEHALARCCIWQEQGTRYARIVEMLSELYILATEPCKRWIAKMALQQLLLECPVDVLVGQRSFVECMVPKDMQFIVHHRLAGFS